MSVEKAWELLNRTKDLDKLDEFEMFKFAYHAGLLHAAKQDEQATNEYNKIGWIETADSFRKSAAMHRQAASEVK